MEVIEVRQQQHDLTLRQRSAQVFTILVAMAALLYGVNLRNSILSATSVFDSDEFGITALYPQDWLIDTTGDYVFRVRDMSRTGFKTTFQVALQPVGEDAQERNISDRLTFNRIRTLTAYAVLSSEPLQLGEINGQALTYTFVSQNASPFLQGVPNVVRGMDVLVITGGQAIIITFRADATLFDEEFERFEQFVTRLEF